MTTVASLSRKPSHHCDAPWLSRGHDSRRSPTGRPRSHRGGSTCWSPNRSSGSDSNWRFVAPRNGWAASECQKVFTDFRDGAGQPLQSKLDALQKTGAEFLTWLRFSEGGGLPMCERNPHVAAFTQPGSRVVQVCGAAFAPRSVRDPLANEVLVDTHELLHTLGLEENPPSSAGISRGVLVRCAAEHHFNPSATYKSDSERR